MSYRANDTVSFFETCLTVGLLREHACRGVRHPDYIKQIKCERAQAAAEQAAAASDGTARKAAGLALMMIMVLGYSVPGAGPRPKKLQCDLYSNEERCSACTPAVLTYMI